VDISAHTAGRPPPVYGVPYPGKERIEGVYTGDIVPGPEVMDEPPPKVWFVGFGNSSLYFELLAWIAGPLLRKQVLSDLNYAIDDAFRKHEATIPFPQRDLHLRSLPSREKLEAI